MHYLKYFKFLFKKFLDALANYKKTPAYQLIEIKKMNGLHNLLIQINGTGKIIQCLVNEVINDDELLKGFDIRDIRAIFHLCIEEKNRPNYKIVSNKFTEHNGKTIICFKEVSSGATIEIPSQDVSTNLEFIKQCSSEDAYRAGYLLGLEAASPKNIN